VKDLKAYITIGGLFVVTRASNTVVAVAHEPLELKAAQEIVKRVNLHDELVEIALLAYYVTTQHERPSSDAGYMLSNQLTAKCREVLEKGSVNYKP
jgi:hypothetical protein